MKRYLKYLAAVSACSLIRILQAISQQAPAEDENISFLVTFGGNAELTWGDDDFCQIFFFKVPYSFTEPIYIRVYDPDTGGALDEMKGGVNTTVRFSVFGGPGTWSDTDAKNEDPKGNYESGSLLSSRIFGQSDRYDQKWFSFGPYNPKEGEYIEKLGGYIFKVIAQGVEGDDGNLYRYYMSIDQNENLPVEGGNLFTYEYTFRLPDNPENVSQIYPFLDDQVTSVMINNYDWDNDGYIRVVSRSKRGELCTTSNDGDWKKDQFTITPDERNTTMEIQFIKESANPVRNNNVVLAVHNQYGESLPFFVIPIGGRPVYNPSLKMRSIQKK